MRLTPPQSYLASSLEPHDDLVEDVEGSADDASDEDGAGDPVLWPVSMVVLLLQG